MPKQLAKRHRTFDSCDLATSAATIAAAESAVRDISLEPAPRDELPVEPPLKCSDESKAHANPNQLTRCHMKRDPYEPPPPSSQPLRHHHHHHDDRPNADRDAHSPAQQSHDCLSKLVLSASLHQLADSQFHTHAAHRNHHMAHADASNCDATNDRTSVSNDATASSTTTDSNSDDVGQSHRRRPPPPPPPVSTNNNNNNRTQPNQPARAAPVAQCASLSQTETAPQQQQQQQQRQLNYANSTPTQQHGPRAKREANLDTVHVVVGNESCDLDSAVSCLLMFHIISKMSDEINGKDKTRTLYIPLLNTTRDMLDSKCEVLWFLQKTLNIDKTFLTCKDDIDWAEIKRNGVEVLITLVDHNYNEEFKDIGRIVEIIDHHQIQNAKWLEENQTQLRLTLDTSVGSCTTLVAERLFYIYAEHHVSDEILLLIYGTVLLDTICLSEKANRFTRRDVYLLKKLDHLLGSKKPVRDQLYRQLVEVKNSTRELNFEKLMKRDLKVYRDKRGMRVGIASLFGMAAKEALGLAANIDLDQFFQENHYEAFIIMGLIADLDHSDSISRDLVLISAQPRLYERLRQAFEADTSKLDLVPISGSDDSPDPEDNVINKKKIVDSSSIDCGLHSGPGFCPFYKARIWLQRNVTSSRKVVAPLVLKVLHDGAQ